MSYILPAEHVGVAKATPDGTLDIGGVQLQFPGDMNGDVHVYVRRLSRDLSIAEIHIARHDGLAQEQLDQQNREALEDPRGPDAYWQERGVENVAG